MNIVFWFWGFCTMCEVKNKATVGCAVIAASIIGLIRFFQEDGASAHAVSNALFLGTELLVFLCGLLFHPV
jgi:hypothetical protein